MREAVASAVVVEVGAEQSAHNAFSLCENENDPVVDNGS